MARAPLSVKVNGNTVSLHKSIYVSIAEKNTYFGWNYSENAHRDVEQSEEKKTSNRQDESRVETRSKSM